MKALWRIGTFEHSEMQYQGRLIFVRLGLPEACRWTCGARIANSSDLKKVSLVYQEGVSRVTANTRLRALLFGEDGPNVIVGRAATKDVRQTELSMTLRPPKKWSYGKLILSFALVSFGLLVSYVHWVMESSPPASSAPVILYAVLFPMVFLVCLFLVWRHNHLFYPRQFRKVEPILSLWALRRGKRTRLVVTAGTLFARYISLDCSLQY